MLRILVFLVLVASVGCARPPDGQVAAPAAKDKGNSRGLEVPKDEDAGNDKQGKHDGRQKVALLVGVKEYRGAGFTELKYTERDVEELAAILTKAGYAVRLLTTSAGKTKPADAPTTANIRKAFAELIKGRGKGEMVLLALSGHGIQANVQDPKKQKDPRSYGYFCPADADTTDIDFETGYSDHLIQITDVFEGLGRCQATYKLVLMDACRNEVEAKAKDRGNLDVGGMKVPQGVAALFSCSRNQRAWEHEDLKHGVFFHFVLEGLRGQAKNKRGAVTWDGLSAYVKDEVEVEVPKLIGGGAKQKPAGVGNVEGDPVLLVLGGVKPPDDKAYQDAIKAARAAMDAKKYAEAVEAFDRALKAKPNDEEAKKGKQAAIAALKPAPERDKDRVVKKGDVRRWKVISPIGVGVMKDDQGLFSRNFFSDGEEVTTVESKDKKIKITNGKKDGWLTHEQVSMYLEEVR